MRIVAGRPGAGTEGVAYVEFLIAFLPLFIMFMGMVQMCLMYAGDLVVQHAASRATRAAVVVLDDDPQYYDGAARRRIDRSGRSSSGDPLGGIVGLFGGGGGGSGPPATGGPRISAIRAAASMPLAAISPSLSQLIDSDSVRTAIDSPEARAATGVFMYNNSAMGVTFPTAPLATSYRDSFSHGDQVTARVTYLFHCGVPLVNRMMCETYPAIRLGPAAALVEGLIHDIADGSISFDEGMERLRRADESRRRHERDSPAVRELESSGAADMMYLTAARGAYFKVLRGEATMPLQSAHYRYAGE